MDIALKLALVSSSVQKCEQIKAELWAILPRIAGLGNLINIKEIQHCSGPRVVFSSFSKQQVWELQISPTQVEKLRDGKENERDVKRGHMRMVLARSILIAQRHETAWVSFIFLQQRTYRRMLTFADFLDCQN